LPQSISSLVHRSNSEIEVPSIASAQQPAPPGFAKRTQFQLNSLWLSLLQRWIPRWSPNDPRSRWLAATALTATYPSLLTAAYLPEAVQSLLRQTPKLQNEPNPPPLSSPLPDHPLPTEFAGLYFILPILERLGLPALLETDPAYLDFPILLFQTLARRLRIPPDDPILSPLFHPAGFQTPWGGQSWPQPPFKAASAQAASASDCGSGRSVGQADGLRRAAGPPPAATSWLTQTARWLRRHARLRLRTLARRPGRISWTPTHIDLYLPLRDADIRIRSAGLDLDPGWVPWLAKVIHYHYIPPASPTPPTSPAPPASPGQVTPASAGPHGSKVAPASAGPSGSKVAPASASPHGSKVAPASAGPHGSEVPPASASPHGSEVTPASAGPHGSEAAAPPPPPTPKRRRPLT
jgi:hypothetical protein